MLVGIAFEIGARRRPILLVDQVHDQPLELGGILNSVLRLAIDGAERAGLLAQADKDAGVFDFKVGSLCVEQLLPGLLVGNDLLRVELSRCPFMTHLEEQQVGELLGLLDDADAVVSQNVAVRSELVDKTA